MVMAGRARACALSALFVVPYELRIYTNVRTGKKEQSILFACKKYVRMR